MDQVSHPSSSSSSDMTNPMYPQARHHTYLPGAIHPVASASSPCISQPALHELAVLEWPDSVVFPGMVFPIRFSDPDWIAYLQNQINHIIPNTEHPVRFGLLMGRRRPDPPRRSWARQGQGPAGLRRWSQQLIQELAVQLNEAEDDEEDSALLASPPPMPSYTRPSHRSWNLQEDFAPPTDPFVGRIGTIVTVLYTHGDAVSLSAYRTMAGPLVLTARGTGRFRIVGYRSRAEQETYSRPGRRRCSLQYFRIEEIRDRPLHLPSPAHCLGGAPAIVREEGTAHGYEAHRRRLVAVSPYPSWVVNKMWPWKLVAGILWALQNLPSFAGLLRPGTDDDALPFLHEPVAFSFWLAANLPFQIAEQMEILQMISVVERLMFIYRKVKFFGLHEAAIYCIDCTTLISTSFQMFTVDGAEGTTGHYVNEHGVIHQTITLREIYSGSVHFDSVSHVHDSWFPGYSWTIMSCATCAHHLGWKFGAVPDPTSLSAPTPSTRRPLVFYGVSAANVDICVPTRPLHQVSSSNEDDDNDDVMI